MSENMWRGKLVRLRAVSVADWEPFWLDQVDSEAARASHQVPFPRSPEATRKWLEEHALREPADDAMIFAIETHAGELVGSINTVSCHRRNGTFRYGVGIFRRHWRHGYARDAIRILLRYFFDELGYQKVSAEVYEFNEASIALHEALGFQCEGRLRRQIYTEGRYHDVFWYGLTREEFAEGA
jgi:RimJ/RimL family protein N-acetyltransferase